MAEARLAPPPAGIQRTWQCSLHPLLNLQACGLFSRNGRCVPRVFRNLSLEYVTYRTKKGFRIVWQSQAGP